MNGIRYPMKIGYVPRSRIWGGDRLIRDFGKKSDELPLGESWELTVRADGMSLVENGVYAGKPLGDVLAELGPASVAPEYDGSHFPLLIKLIDATDRLSVQVHPDDVYGRADGDAGKTEMWYILDAAPGAELVYGLLDGIDTAAFAAAVRDGRTEECLRRVPVKRGDVFFIPSGLVHAIGAGILLAEIQQNSDLTYRVYDYNRRGTDGKLRQLHVEKALDVIRPYTEEEIYSIRYACGRPAAGEEGTLLSDCPYFRVLHSDGAGCTEGEAAERFVSLLCVSGEGRLCAGDFSATVRKGDSWYLPAGLGRFFVEGEAELLLSSPR